MNHPLLKHDMETEARTIVGQTCPIDRTPHTSVEPVVDLLHGVKIVDPYRWLEDQNSPRTRKWIEEQTAYTQAYFHAVPNRDLIRKRVAELLPLNATSDIWNAGKRYFFLKRREGSQQPAITMRNGLLGPETVLVEAAPPQIGSSMSVAIAAISGDGRFLAYLLRQGGTDHARLHIFDTERNTTLPDYLPEGFCTGIVFAPDGSGFYYSHRHAKHSESHQKAVFWHTFGEARSDDREVFFAGDDPNLFLAILHSVEAQLLAFLVFRAGKIPCMSIYLQPMLPSSSSRLLLHDIEGCFVPFFVRNQLLAYTDLDAPNRRIVLIPLEEPTASQWRNIVPESDQSIHQFAAAGDQIFVTRVSRFSSTIEAFGLDGAKRGGLSFSQHGTVRLLNRTTSTNELFFSYSSIHKPASAYCYSTKSERLHQWGKKHSAEHAGIAVEEVSYTSKDGTSVPLLLAAKKELLHSVALPTFLTGYGGFGNCVTPRFTAFASFLIEQGFLFAVPALRGGSELGQQWHSAGRGKNRQNSFDDFIAAAEWLLAQGRSAAGRIAIGGGSNAGLLVGAALTQRPDLFRAVVCLGPLLDMTRYHLFDVASRWADEYGSPEDEEDFRYLFGYSPYHRVSDGVPYPAVMLISGDADTRCNPMHARKMTARLQAASSSGHSVLLDYKADWGHTPAQPLSIKIDALADRLAFVCRELGVHIK